MYGILYACHGGKHRAQIARLITNGIIEQDGIEGLVAGSARIVPDRWNTNINFYANNAVESLGYYVDNHLSIDIDRDINPQFNINEWDKIVCMNESERDIILSMWDGGNIGVLPALAGFPDENILSPESVITPNWFKGTFSPWRIYSGNEKSVQKFYITLAKQIERYVKTLIDGLAEKELISKKSLQTEKSTRAV